MTERERIAFAIEEEPVARFNIYRDGLMVAANIAPEDTTIPGPIGYWLVPTAPGAPEAQEPEEYTEAETEEERRLREMDAEIEAAFRESDVPEDDMDNEDYIRGWQDAKADSVDPRSTKPCPGCARGDVPVMLDEDGTFCSVSGEPGRLGHGVDDRFFFCADYSEAQEPERSKYNELLYAVASKFPGESRHETALRYIRQAEHRDSGPYTTSTSSAAGEEEPLILDEDGVARPAWLYGGDPNAGEEEPPSIASTGSPGLTQHDDTMPPPDGGRDARKVAERVVESLGDDEPDPETEAAQDFLAGTPHESLWMLTTERLTQVIEVAVSDALFDATRTPQPAGDVEALGTEDEANPHLITAGRDRNGAFLYPFLDCDELCADQPAGRAVLGHILQVRAARSEEKEPKESER